MFVLSVQDILKLDKFKHLSEIQLLDKKYDKEVLEEAYTVGLADDEGYTYEYQQHRPISSKKPIYGYVLKGEVRKDPAFRKSSVYTPEMQMLSTVRSDVSLTKELGMMSGVSFDYGKTIQEESEKWDTEDSYEPDADTRSDELFVMNELVKRIRGNPYNDWGKLKTFGEWVE